MSVRKRKWTTTKGIEKEVWIADYADAQGVRRLKTFAKKKEADAFSATANVEVRAGTHVADSASATIAEAGNLWIAASEAAGLERSTINQYRQHLELHIKPLIGDTLLSKMTVPVARAFEDDMRVKGRSAAMIRKVMVSLGSLLSDAQERALTQKNAVRDMRKGRRRGKDGKAERRQKGRLRVGVDIPSRDEIKLIVGALTGRWRPLLITAIFTGLRASELRGLRWSDVDMDRREIHVRQRADRFNAIGMPKTDAGNRIVPLPPVAVSALQAWRDSCPESELDLAFPNGAGNIESLANIINRGLMPAQVAAGVVIDTGKKNAGGEPILKARYTGMHALRHFYASWCINRKEDGGMALPPKAVQERLGHSSITMTMDVYGHLFSRGDDAEELAAAERALLAS